ncbi:MAG TPA: patatin-like phospholipase family protein [Candidatus Kapabacteria bacterium]|jgi:NTE family protein|nr:patatin-like phospholipase family protein [Candidatus Kapabacteria bacterium]
MIARIITLACLLSLAPVPSVVAQWADSTLLKLPEASRLSRTPSIALVLSGGGAKGFAHIGVLDVLDSARIPIDLIVGTSIGAAIGGLYAAGYTPAQLEHFALTTDWLDVLELSDESHRNERVLSQKDADNALLSLRYNGFFSPVIPQAISSGERLTMLLNSMVIGAPGGVPQDFLRDMRVPFVAVATDIVNGERRLLTKGDLTEALRASATLPLRFNPLAQDSSILMDGGLLDNIPVDIARSMGASEVIVSNATARLRSREELTTPWDVADQVISLMMQRENVKQLQHSDIIITPDLPEVTDIDFRNIDSMIEEGRMAARAMLPTIRKYLTTATMLDPPDLPPPANDTMLRSIDDIRVYGETKFHDTSLEKDRSFIGQPLIKSQDLKTMEHWLMQDYRMHGYSLARIDSVVVRPMYGRVDFFMDEGRIAQVRVIGENGGSSDLVLHELPFSSGDIFHAHSGEQALENLTGTGLFDFATLRIEYDSLWPGTQYRIRVDSDLVARPDGIRRSPEFGPMVLLTVHSRASNVIRLGVLADNEFGAQFSTELANENIAGSGIEASIRGGLGPLSRFASFTLDAPRLLQSFALMRAQVYSGYKDIDAYSLQTITSDNRIVSNVTDVVRESRDLGIRLDAGGQIERLGAVTVALRSERQNWYSIRDSVPAINRLQLTALRGELVVDSRDDAAYPHNGTYIRGYDETGLQFLGGQTSYTKIFGEIEQAIPLSSLHTIIPRFRIGFADAPLPRLEQFELGGMESFYGLNEYELRGKQMLEGSLTYQIAIPHVLFFPTYVSTRYDVGAVWPQPEQIKFESLVHGIGAQVGLKTPLGLARFGIGENFRFNEAKPHPIDLNKPRFYFSIGSLL